MATKPRKPVHREPVKQPEKFRTRVETITPEVAEKWLEKNFGNRNLRKPLEDRTVQAYARDMQAGRWHLTGDPLIFDTNGDLMNGQHRLWACIIADSPFRTNVAYNVEPEARIVIDTGKKRMLGHYLHMSGETNATSLAAAVNLCFRWDQGNINSDGSGAGTKLVVSHEDAMEWLAENPDIRESVQVGMGVYRAIKYGQTQASAAHYLNARVDPEAADEFWEGVRTGAELPADSPILSLLRWTMNQRTNKGSLEGELILIHFLKAMQMWKLGKRSRILSVKTGEQVTTWSR